MEAIIWIGALVAFAAIPYLFVHAIRKWKQVSFNRKWGLPEEPAAEADSAEIMGKTGVAFFLDPWNKR